jgi:hypothetical protein
MAKKKRRFTFMDALGIASDVAGIVGDFKSMQKEVKDANKPDDKVGKSFESGNSTNLAGAEGGVSQRKPLALNEVDKYLN